MGGLPGGLAVKAIAQLGVIEGGAVPSGVSGADDAVGLHQTQMGENTTTSLLMPRFLSQQGNEFVGIQGVIRSAQMAIHPLLNCD